ncbi:MAG: hypothetical protein ACTS22_03865 [Phycisphaerales bacterium]
MVRCGVAGAVLGCMISSGVAAQMTDAERERAATYEAVTEAVLPSIVRVEFVISMENPWGGGTEEQEMEVPGTIISPEGLVLVSNSMVGGWYAMFSEMQVVPKDIKVLIGDDTEGVDASIVARDSERDLCWIRLDELPESPLPHMDVMAASEEPGVGTTLYQVVRLGEFFGRAPVVNESTVTAKLSKPRELLYLGMGSAETGMPVVRADGSIAGVMIFQVPSQDEMEAAGGFGGGMYDSFIQAVLPAAEVAIATEAALSLDDEGE